MGDKEALHEALEGDERRIPQGIVPLGHAKVGDTRLVANVLYKIGEGDSDIPPAVVGLVPGGLDGRATPPVEPGQGLAILIEDGSRQIGVSEF
jgi:hypothetical protein